MRGLPSRALYGFGRLLRLDVVATAAFVALLVAWGSQVSHLYQNQQSTGDGWGNASIGLSDAALWQRGGLRFFFGLGGADTNLYRPTVGIIFGSMIAFLGSSRGIAIVPPLICAAMFLGTYFSWNARDRPLLLVFLYIITCFFGEMFSARRGVSIGTLMTEPAAWTFTLVAFLLIADGVRGDRIAMPPTLVGFLALGVVAAIRGLHLAGGLLVFLGVSIWFSRRERPRRLAVLLLAFLAPVVLDGVLQRVYGVSNNAYQLFATFAKPPHTYVDANRFEYIRLHAPGSVALKMFADFMIHGDGASVCVRFMAQTAEEHLRLVPTTVLLALATLASLATRLGHAGRRPSGGARALAVGHLLVLAAVTLGEVNRWLVLSWICAMFVVAVWRRMPCTLVASGVYLGCLALYICTCSPGGLRTASTFLFLLYFAIVAFGWEVSRDSRAPVEDGPMKLVAGLVAATIASLYFGSVVIRLRPAQRTFAREVMGRNAAMKIADDHGSRSLYMDGRGETFFARADDRPVGSVFRYSKIKRSPVPDYIKEDPGYEPSGITFLTSDRAAFELVP